MINFKLKYNDGSEKISIQNNIEDESTTIEWYIENMCRFLVALGFSKTNIQKYIPYDGEVYTTEDWNEDENSDDSLK